MSNTLLKVGTTDNPGYDDLKLAAQQSVTDVSQTFTWTAVVTVDSPIKVADINEIMSAVDLAYNSIVYSVTGNSGLTSNSITATYSVTGYSNRSYNNSNNSSY